MNFKFKIQQYQTDAVEAVVNVFSGQGMDTGTRYTRDLGSKKFENIQATLDGDEFDDNYIYDIGYKNERISLSDDQLLANIRRIQQENNIKASSSLVGDLGRCSLDVEMETGTGKTYVYIKTMFELNKRYGWTKFIVVVPSIAIREGVKKSFETMEDHFMEHYGKKARYFIYNSSNLNQLDSFSGNSGLNVMIINTQAFASSLKEGAKNKESRIIYSKRDEFGSRRPIDVIKANRPILILDEPQKMGGEVTQKALKNFNPLFSLNYSATHKTQHNLVYVLDALDAFNKRLVKKIEVKGFEVKNFRGTDKYLYLEQIILSKNKPPIAKIEMEIGYNKSINRESRTVGVGDDLFFYVTPDGKYAAFSSTRSLDDPNSRLYSPSRIISYVVDYEEEPVKHIATSEEAYELSRLRIGNVLTQKQRDSINNAEVAKALEGVERKSGLAEMDSTARKTTERYTAATQKYRALKSSQEKLQSSQAAYRDLYSDLTARMSQNLSEEEASLKRDSLQAISDLIAQSETAAYAVSQQIREVENEIHAIESIFMSTGVVVPSSNAFKSAEQLKAEAETGVAQEEEENIANMLSNKSQVENNEDFKVERIRPKVDLTFKVQKKGMLVDLEDFPDGLIYQIRFLSSLKKLTETSFKGLSPVFERQANGRYTYAAGAFHSYSDAYRQLSRVKKAGFSSATIVAFENGEAIPLEVARKKEAPTPKTAGQKGKKGSYNVVILSDESSLDPDVMKLVQSSGKDIAKTPDGGSFRFICGPFSSQKEADELSVKLRAVSDKKISVEAVN